MEKVVSSDSPKSFEKKFHMHFGSTDAGGVMYFARIYDLAHDAMEDFVRASGAPWELWFGLKEIGVPIRKSECEYLRPFYAGREYVVSVYPTDFSEHSLKLAFEFSLLKSDESKSLHAIASLDLVFIDFKTRKKIPIPPAIKEKLLPYLKVKPVQK